MQLTFDHMHAMYEDYSSQASLRIMQGAECSRDVFDGVKHTVQHGGEVCPNYTISGEQ